MSTSERVLRFLLWPWLRLTVAWVAALVISSWSLHTAWNSFNTQQRNDGNEGHATIDFGGQWLLGRMLVEGHGRRLYDRAWQREVLKAHYPRSDEDPRATTSDADNLMGWVMGSDDPRAAAALGSFVTPLAAGDVPSAVALAAAGEQAWQPIPFGIAWFQGLNSERQPVAMTAGLASLAGRNGLEVSILLQAGPPAWQTDLLERASARQVGGPLYPPINAFVYAPLALLKPPHAYHAIQVANILLAFLAGLGVSYLSRGRIWLPVAAAFIILYPGFKASINLGQNATLTLAIVVWGWALIARGRPVLGGLVWGLLAFKPVWGLAIVLVPFLTRRWRVCLSMAGMGLVLAAATVPFVGIQSWRDWLHVGREATQIYNADYNWIFLSRDILGIPRRWLLDFDLPRAERDHLMAMVASWLLWAMLLEVTIRLTTLRSEAPRLATGPGPAFLFLGAWMSCYHFMYYDVLLTALPVLLLLADRGSWLHPTFLVFASLSPRKLGEAFLSYYQPWVPGEYPAAPPLLRPGHHQVWVVNYLAPYLVVLLLLIEHLFPSLPMGASLTAGFLPPQQTRQTVTGSEKKGSATVPATKTKSKAVPPTVVLSTGLFNHPWDTYVLVLLWLWAGWRWVWTDAGPWLASRGGTPEVIERSTHIRRAHE